MYIMPEQTELGRDILTVTQLYIGYRLRYIAHYIHFLMKHLTCFSNL